MDFNIPLIHVVLHVIFYNCLSLIVSLLALHFSTQVHHFSLQEKSSRSSGHPVRPRRIDFGPSGPQAHLTHCYTTDESISHGKSTPSFLCVKQHWIIQANWLFSIQCDLEESPFNTVCSPYMDFISLYLFLVSPPYIFDILDLFTL